MQRKLIGLEPEPEEDDEPSEVENV
jgi:hypothetical protein